MKIRAIVVAIVFALAVGGPASATAAATVYQSHRLTVTAQVQIHDGPSVQTEFWFTNNIKHRIRFDCAWTATYSSGSTSPMSWSGTLKKLQRKGLGVEGENVLPTDMTCTATKASRTSTGGRYL